MFSNIFEKILIKFWKSIQNRLFINFEGSSRLLQVWYESGWWCVETLMDCAFKFQNKKWWLVYWMSQKAALKLKICFDANLKAFFVVRESDSNWKSYWISDPQDSDFKKLRSRFKNLESRFNPPMPQLFLMSLNYGENEMCVWKVRTFMWLRPEFDMLWARKKSSPFYGLSKLS